MNSKARKHLKRWTSNHKHILRYQSLSSTDEAYKQIGKLAAKDLDERVSDHIAVVGTNSVDHNHLIELTRHIKIGPGPILLQTDPPGLSQKAMSLLLPSDPPSRSFPKINGAQTFSRQYPRQSLAAEVMKIFFFRIPGVSNMYYINEID
jgi:hypothetical protein